LLCVFLYVHTQGCFDRLKTYIAVTYTTG
jgi:hypothetical protein